MLGLHKMTHDGTAKVVSCQLRVGMLAMTSTNSHGASTSTFDLILDVFPDGGQPFRAETHHQFSAVRAPDVGDSLKVRCNPEKHAVKIDISDDERFNPKIFRAENKRKREEEHDRLMNAAPGSPVPGDAADIEARIRDREATLKELDERLERGDISDETYNAEVDKLIGGIGHT